MPDNAASRRVAIAVAEMPSWKKRLMLLTMIAGILGGGAKLATMFTEKSSDQAAVSQNVEVSRTAADGDTLRPENSSGFIGGRTDATNSPTTAGTYSDTTTAAPEPSTTAKVSSWVAKIGLSIFVGLIVGTIFRMFVKTMAVIAAVAIAAIVALSYFQVINVDFTTMKENYDSFAGWAQAQVGKFKDVVLTSLPSAGSALAGFVLGLKK